MRYYLYLDKNFLRSLFASIPDSNFDVEIMEFSIQKGETVIKDINIAPNANEMMGSATWQRGKDKDKESDDKSEQRKQVTGGVTFFAGEKNTYNTIVERRYINIEDISGIKNLSFYNKLVERLEEMCTHSNHLCVELGKIYPCKLRNIYEIENENNNKNNSFFCINNKYIWVDNNYLETDLFFLSTITSNVKVLGFTINKINNIEILKAVAIYIE